MAPSSPRSGARRPQPPHRSSSPTPEPPLPAEILTRPAAFGKAVAQAGVPAWQYWPAVLVAALLSGVCYALLLRPGLNLAAQAAGPAAHLAPGILTHISNAFGSVFLTALTFGAMWGLGRLPAGQAHKEPLPIPQIFSATFTLPVLLYVLVLVLIALTPASAWALDSAQVAAAQGNGLTLQRVALRAAAHTPAAQVLIWGSLFAVAAQCVLAYQALRSLSPRALPMALLPLLPVLGLQLLGFAALLAALWVRP